MKRLLDYYKECFDCVDSFHFNSEVSREVFVNALGNRVGYTIPITHQGILDNRRIRPFSNKGLVVGFIGNDTPYKGLQILKECVKDLNIQVMVWGGKKKDDGQIHYRGKYCQEWISEVFNELDVLVVPSLWKETFSLVTLEALSYGLPVIVSYNVGAKDIVMNYDEHFVFRNSDELRILLEELCDNKEQLVKFNKKIMDMEWNHNIQQHTMEIINKLYKG